MFCQVIEMLNAFVINVTGAEAEAEVEFGGFMSQLRIGGYKWPDSNQTDLLFYEISLVSSSPHYCKTL